MRVALIPARGGSKRIPRKNIRSFAGAPMISWPIRAARDSGCFDRIIVSTEDAEIAGIARTCGAETPFVRPDDIADDHATTQEVVRHAIGALAEQGPAPSALCCIYATAPFLAPGDLRAGFERLEAGGCDYVFAGTRYVFPIQRALFREGEGFVRMVSPEAFATRSQDLEEAWHDAGQFYWATPSTWLSPGPVFSPKSVGIEIPRDRAIDIDTEEDWRLAEALFAAGRSAGRDASP
jgi:pseudaminic acid cytidylyltransferase